MNNQTNIIALAAAVVGMIATLLGLVASGASVYAALVVRALRSDLEKEMAQLEVRIIEGVSKSYVTTQLCNVRHAALDDRMVIAASLKPN